MRWYATPVLVCAAAVARAEDPAPTVICDFDSGEPTDGWTIRSLGVAEVETPHGRGLRLSVAEEPKDGPAGWIVRACGVHDWRTFRAFSLHLRVEAKAPVSMRLLAVGEGGRGRLLRRFTAEPGDWREVVLDLKDFRGDGDDAAASFAAIGQVTLRWDKGTGDVSVDDLRLLPGTRGALSCRPTGEDLQRIAFGDTKARRTESAHFLVVDDVPTLSDADVTKLLARLEEGLAVLGDRYGVKGELGERVPFLLFATRAEYEECARRLGDHYGASVTPPKADGYGIFGVGMGFLDPAQGWNRPVFVHEALHGAIHRLLGIESNGNWIQEGLANAVQVRLSPASLDASKLAEGFEKRAGWIVAWSRVFEKPRAGMGSYPEILSIMDFLAERHRDALPSVWGAVRALRGPLHVAAPGAIAKALRTDATKLEAEWLAWGAAYYRRAGK